MKIRLLIGIPGYAPGAVLEAAPAPHYAVNNPKWFIAKSKVGVYAYEAEEITKEQEYENEEDQGAEVPVLQTADDGRVVASTGRGDPVMDVPVLPAQPARQATEDAERLVDLFYYLSDEDGKWLRAKLIEWLNSLLYRGALLTYKDKSLTAVRDALTALEL